MDMTAETKRPPADEGRPENRSEGPAAAPPQAKGQSQSSSRVAEANAELQELRARQKRRPAVIVAAVLAGLLLIAGGAYYYFSGLGVASTDDAYIAGNATSAAPQIAGRVASLDVVDNEFVHAGQPIIHIDDRPFVIARDAAQAALDAAQAQAKSAKISWDLAKIDYPANLSKAQGALATAQANLANARANYERQIHLTNLSTSPQQVDAARAAYHQAQGQVQQAQADVAQATAVSQHIAAAEAQYEQQQAQVEQAQSKLKQAELNLSYTIVRAPVDGWITNRSVATGDYVNAGQQIVALVSPKIWVTANFKETELDRLRPGDPVDIHVDAYPNLKLKGEVESVQRGTGSQFSAFPPENATGNFVKIVQRVPVKIKITKGLDKNDALPLGLSVVPTVHLQ